MCTGQTCERCGVAATMSQIRQTQTISDTAAIRRILVGVDFSENSASALTWATDLANSRRAKIILAHSIEGRLPGDNPASELLLQEVRQRLDSLQGLIKACGIDGKSESRSGPAWQVIPKIARDNAADLIVLGAHGKTDFKERFLGSTATRIIQSTSIPVVIIHRDRAPVLGSRKTILVATDFSDESALATNMAIRLSQKCDQPTRIILFHAVPFPVNNDYSGAPVAVPRFWDEAMQCGIRQMERLANGIRADSLLVEMKIVPGDPADAILRYAAESHADLIAMGSQGYTGIHRLLMGSTAARVLRHSSCPVLVVRKPESCDSDEPRRA